MNMLANELTNAIHPGRKKFVGVRKNSWGVRMGSLGLAKIRNMLLKFARKALFTTYS